MKESQGKSSVSKELQPWTATDLQIFFEINQVDCTAAETLQRVRQLCSVTTDDYVVPVFEVLQLEYWARMWILQEYIKARDLVVQYGTTRVDAKHLQGLMELLLHFKMIVSRFQGNLSDMFRSQSTIANSFDADFEQYMAVEVIGQRRGANYDGPLGFALLLRNLWKS